MRPQKQHLSAQERSFVPSVIGTNCSGRTWCDVGDFCSQKLPRPQAWLKVSPMPEPAVSFLRTLGLLVATATAEIVGCYLPYLWLRKSGSPWFLLPAALSLASFAWLLTLHPMAAGRTYASYGGVYVFCAILWLWLVEGSTPDRWDVIGASLSIAGMVIIVLGPRDS